MSRVLRISLAAGVYAAAAYFLNPFLLKIAALSILIGIGIPASIVAILLLLASIPKRSLRRSSLVFLATLAICGSVIALLVGANHLLVQYAVSTAKEYPLQILPYLEEYRKEHGVYPTTLDQLPAKPSLPRLLKRPGSYRSSGDRYSFNFEEPGRIMDRWHYESDTRTWHVF